MLYLWWYIGIGGALSVISFFIHGHKELNGKSPLFQAIAVVVYIVAWPIWILIELWRFLIKL